MFGKFIIFLLIVIATQSSAKSYYIHEEGQRDVQEIREEIKKLMERVDLVNNFLKTKLETMDKLKEKITALFSNVTLELLIDNITEEVENRIEGSGENVEECLAEQEDAIRDLARYQLDETITCVDNATDTIKDLESRMEKLLLEADRVIEDIVARVKRCEAENPPNTEGLMNCLKDEIKPMTKDVKAVEDKKKLLQNEVESAEMTITVELNKCLMNIAPEFYEKEQEIIDDVNLCISN